MNRAEAIQHILDEAYENEGGEISVRGAILAYEQAVLEPLLAAVRAVLHAADGERAPGIPDCALCSEWCAFHDAQFGGEGARLVRELRAAVDNASL